MPNVHYAWFIGLAAGSILLFIAYYFLSSFNYKRRFNNKYEVLNYFPYELNFEGKFADNLLGNVAFHALSCNPYTLHQSHSHPENSNHSIDYVSTL